MILTFRCADNAQDFLTLARKAAGVWNDVLSGHVQLREWQPRDPRVTTTVPNPVNILIQRDSAEHPRVRTPAHPHSVAQCARVAPDYWLIDMGWHVKWALSGWARFWGNGEDAFTALIHEFGHVFAIPHSDELDDVMHPEIGGNGRLSRPEKTQYRAQFLSLLEDDQ